ncbi:MAG: PAS domain S-box protein [Actinomycetia bacterium]|nr:PAS domain S-box protein [Actinomycetes bacterium]
MTASGFPDINLETAWESVPDGLILVDEDGCVRWANSEVEALFGLAADDLIGCPVEDLVPADAVVAHRNLRETYSIDPARRPMGRDRHLEGRRADDSIFPVQISLAPLIENGTRWTLAAVRDVSDWVGTEQRLAESTRRHLLAEDHDRIARDLHDSVIQELFAIGMGLQATLSTIGDPDTAARVDRSIVAIDDVIRSIRGVIYDVSTRESDKGVDTKDEIVRIVADLTPTLGFEPHLAFSGPIDSLGRSEVVPHIVAVVREGLTNVARHAQASSAEVSVEVTDRIRVTVSDDGVGLADVTRRSGLANMADRAGRLDGSLDITVGVTGGTVLQWTIPREAG